MDRLNHGFFLEKKFEFNYEIINNYSILNFKYNSNIIINKLLYGVIQNVYPLIVFEIKIQFYVTLDPWMLILKMGYGVVL